MDCISKLTCDDKIFLNETMGKITEMIESKGDSLTQRQREYIEMLDRVYDLKTVNKTESFLGGIIRTIGFATSSISGKKMVDYQPALPIIKMCMEFVYIRNNKHEYDEFSEVFDELPVSRKEFKNICHEIEKEAVNGIEHIINKYEMAKIKADEKEGIFWIDVPEIHIPAFKMTVDVSYGSEWEEEWNEIEEAMDSIAEYFELNKTTLPKGYLREITAEIKNRISAGVEEAEDKYRGD